MLKHPISDSKEREGGEGGREREGREGGGGEEEEEDEKEEEERRRRRGGRKRRERRRRRRVLCLAQSNGDLDTVGTNEGEFGKKGRETHEITSKQTNRGFSFGIETKTKGTAV